MTLINKQMAELAKGILGSDYIEKEVKKQWNAKNSCLANLSNKNKDELKKIELKLLKGFLYKGKPTEELFKQLKTSKDITKEQKEFAKYIFENYPKHSIKAMGFN